MNAVTAPGRGTDIDPGRRFEALLLEAGSARDLEAGMQAILASGIRAVGAQKGIVQKLDGQGTLHIVAQFGCNEEYLSCYRQVSSADNRACSRAIRTGRPVFMPDVDLDPDYRPYLDCARMAGYRSVLSFPLISHEGNLLGAICAQFTEPTVATDEALKSFDIHARLAARFMERLIRQEQA